MCVMDSALDRPLVYALFILSFLIGPIRAKLLRSVI